MKTAGCHVLFSSVSEAARWPAILNTSRELPYWTVSDIDQFITQRRNGWGLSLEQHSRCASTSNLNAAERAHLKIIPQLLKNWRRPSLENRQKTGALKVNSLMFGLSLQHRRLSGTKLNAGQSDCQCGRASPRLQYFHCVRRICPKPAN